MKFAGYFTWTCHLLFFGNYPSFTNNMRNIRPRTQTLDRQSFVHEKPKSLSLILSSFHSIIKAKHPVKQLAFPQNRGVWVTKQHSMCINFHAFSQCMARSSRVHDKSTARKTQRTLLDLNRPEEKRLYMSFVFSLIILKHQFLKNHISVIYWFICSLKSIKIIARI